MKNSANLAFVILILVILGCSCPKKEESSKQADNKTAASDKPKTSSEKPEDAPKSTATDDLTTPTRTSTDAGGTVTLDKYNRLEYGMTYLEVVKIIGFDGKIIKVLPDGTVRYIWGDDTRFIMITFMNDRVEIKSQNGLD